MHTNLLIVDNEHISWSVFSAAVRADIFNIGGDTFCAALALALPAQCMNDTPKEGKNTKPDFEKLINKPSVKNTHDTASKCKQDGCVN